MRFARPSAFNSHQVQPLYRSSPVHPFSTLRHSPELNPFVPTAHLSSHCGRKRQREPPRDTWRTNVESHLRSGALLLSRSTHRQANFVTPSGPNLFVRISASGQSSKRLLCVPTTPPLPSCHRRESAKRLETRAQRTIAVSSHAGERFFAHRTTTEPLSFLGPALAL